MDDNKPVVVEEPYATAMRLEINPNSGTSRITRERHKQIVDHGYTPEHDSGYKNNELLFGAMAYLSAAIYGDFVGMEDWPFPAETWKYDDKETSLEKAGAFIAAYLDAANYNRKQEEDAE